jgi:nucleoside-diphosphate-sugar epimerase
MLKNILISGGAGFLGSHLCDYYVSTHNVVCLDNLSTGSTDNIAHLLDEDNFMFIEFDITKDFTEDITEKTYDIVINLASPASPPKYQELAIETLNVGSIGTNNMLDIALKDNARFLHASTSEVYGDPAVHPQVESYWGNVNSYGPRSMYDESKRFSEALIYSHKRKYGTNTTIARFFNTYGPRMDKDDGRVVSNFINQAISSKDITVYGDGSQTRSFCFVDDLVTGIVKLVSSDIEGPVNLGNPNEFTIAELADMVIDMVPTKSKLIRMPLPEDDPLLRNPDISLAKKELNWEPEVQLKEGLAATIKYFKAI